MKQLEDLKILVVGDIMLDKYIEGVVNRISPEAPVPIVNVTHEYHTLGGCGNVARNIRELGCNVECLASIGPDIEGKMIENELEMLGIYSLLIHGSTKTTTKTRIIADTRKVQMLRYDSEDTRTVHQKSLANHVLRGCGEYDIIVVSDYAKGMISYEIMKYLKENFAAPIIVDPKPSHGQFYDGVFMITPNKIEWDSMIVSSAYNLAHVNYILETKGSRGMTLIDNQNDISHDISGEEVQVYNVSGAGDTVVAIMSVCLSLGYDPLTAAKIANKCAGYVVTQPGTSIVPKNIFMKKVDCVIGG